MSPTTYSVSGTLPLHAPVAEPGVDAGVPGVGLVGRVGPGWWYMSGISLEVSLRVQSGTVFKEEV